MISSVLNAEAGALPRRQGRPARPQGPSRAALRRRRADRRAASAFAISLAASVLASWALLGAETGLAVTSAVAVHEFGHYVVARACRAALSGPLVFAPLGGLVVVDELALERYPRRQMAVIAAGPLAGAGLTWAAVAMFAATGSHWALQLAWTSAILNVINLIPRGWLDGGRLAKLAGWDPWRWRWLWVVGALVVYPLLSLTLLLATSFRNDADTAVRHQPPIRRLAVLTLALVTMLNGTGLVVVAAEILK